MSGKEQADVDFAELYRRLDQADRALTDAGELDKARRAQLLEARARAVAAAPTQQVVDVLPVLAFSVGGERYGVRMEEVELVTEARGLTPLPGAPPYVLGALGSRGTLVTVVDLRALLGLASGGLVDLGRVVVVREGAERWAIAAEHVEGRLDLPRASLRTGFEGPFHAVSDDQVAVLELSRLGAGVAEGG